MNNYKNKFSYLLVVSGLILSLVSCDNPNDTGWEFAPNMYNSRAYEAQTQWRSNSVNPNGMNMRLPAEGSISRTKYATDYLQDDSTMVHDLMMYDIPKDSVAMAGRLLTNPIPWSEGVEEEGKVLYERNCQHCHGAGGAGDGKVAEKYKGVPNYSSDAYKNIPAGHIYWVITNGKGRMWPHGAQVLPAERWKIVHYVQRLQLGS